MQLIQDLINNKSSRICTRSPSGFVLEVTSDSSGHRVVAANPVDQNLCQYFVVTELPGQGSYTIANTAATGTFLEPKSPTTSSPLDLTASPRRFDDENQEWNFIFEENVNGWDYYSIESVRYPGNVLVLDKTGLKFNVRGQSSLPAVYQHWCLVPAGGSPDPIRYYNQDNESSNLMELQELKDKVAELQEKIAERDSLIKDKNEEISQLKEVIGALNTPTVDPVSEPEAVPGQAATAVVLYDFEATEDFEMSLLQGEYIKHIEECDDGWWSGIGRGGKTGLFPSSFVRLLEASDLPPPPPEIPATHVGDEAVALYDYHGAEDNQVTFREGDKITDVVSEHWLRGKTPSGEIGLFPAIYVNFQSQSPQSSSLSSGCSRN